MTLYYHRFSTRRRTPRPRVRFLEQISFSREIRKTANGQTRRASRRLFFYTKHDNTRVVRFRNRFLLFSLSLSLCPFQRHGRVCRCAERFIKAVVNNEKNLEIIMFLPGTHEWGMKVAGSRGGGGGGD